MFKNYQSYQEAVDYIYSLIPETSADDHSQHKFPGEKGLGRMKLLLNLLDNPQEKYKSVHIAGTSGKGSTAYLTSLALSSQGFKVGLTMSPHLVDIRERLQIGMKYISKADFVRNLNEILPAVRKVADSEFGDPTYFEVLIALAFYSFYKAGVDYAVVEVGLGGLLDGTNAISRSDKVCVINKIGLDHMHILGDSLEEIAYQKAGIIQEGNDVFVMNQKDNVVNVIKEFAKRKEARNFEVVKSDFAQTMVEDLKLGLVGKHQLANCGLALKVLDHLASRDGFEVDIGIDIDIGSLRIALEAANLVGRFDVRQIKGLGEASRLELILDGAHNPQKIRAFVEAVSEVYPGEKFVILFAAKWDKDFESMLALLGPIAKKFVLTTFSGEGQDFKHNSVRLEKMAAFLEKTKFLRYEVEKDLSKAYELAVHSADKDEVGLIVTGSLYLLGDVYKNVLDFNRLHR